MSTYFGTWKTEPSVTPVDPKVAMQLYMAFQAQLKRDLRVRRDQRVTKLSGK